jgi:CRP-like cAMP-binding protein
MYTPSHDSLREVPLFASLNEESLDHVARLFSEFEAPAGQVLAEVGHAGTGCFFIEEGTVRVDLPDGEHVMLGPGDFFGELAILTDARRVGRVVTTTPIKAAAIRRNDLMDLLHQEPSIAVAMLQEVARRLVDAESR